MKPLIGITAGTIYNKERPYSPFTYGQMHTYVEAVIEAGGIPVILPITEDDQMTRELFDRVDGIMFAGGNDISAELYGYMPIAVDNYDIPRDTHEIRLMKMALAAHKPMLGICRGMQMLNAIRGGTLYQDIKAELPEANNHDGYLEVKSVKHLAHKLRIEPNSKLEAILGSGTIRANTHHHQAINQVGEGLAVNAYAEDGIIEGIEDMSQGYVMAVQSHPESLFQDAEPGWRLLFESFVNASKK